MAEITLLLGGARSGKSSYAVDLAKNFDGQVVFLATGVSGDKEMKEKIEQHKRSRPISWETIEEPLNIDTALKNASELAELILLDCLTFWVSNLLLHYRNQGKSGAQLEKEVLNQVEQVTSTAKRIESQLIIISNEVGMGVVPESSLGRIFRDILGRANQLVASYADQVFLLVAGLPIKVK